LVGHDWGGAIGYAFCGKYPDMASQYIVCNLPHPESLAEQWKKSIDQVDNIVVQWKPLNVINLGQRENVNINQICNNN
jgi:pimeloyl-ACP methyl ester carboxylesterase